MSWIHLVYKDLREHSLSLFSLSVGFLIVLLVAFQQQRSGTFNMSTFQVVRFFSCDHHSLNCFYRWKSTHR